MTTRLWLGFMIVAGSSWILSARGASRGAAVSSGDLRGIQELHQQDVSATLSGDPQALADLFTDDAVLLEPGSAAVMGKQAILAENKKEMAEKPGAKVLSYKPDIRDTQVIDGWAFEWANFDGSFRESEKGEAKSIHGKSLRVLKRQPDGSWKFARVMWNLAEDTGSKQ